MALNNMETIRVSSNDKVTFIPPESVKINNVLYKIISVETAVNRTEEWGITSFDAVYTFKVERIDNISILTEKDIIDKYCEEYLKFGHSSERVFPNIFYKGFECDVLRLTNAGMTYEYEIKISKSDFNQDSKKKRYGKNKYKELASGHRVNYFSYIVPHNLISIDDIPEWAGLMYISEDRFIQEIKKPHKLSSAKISDKEIEGLYKSIYYRFHKLRLK